MHEATASVQSSIFAECLLFPNGIHCAWSSIFLYIRGFHTSMCLQEGVFLFTFSQPGFLHDPTNGTIELIWFSSLYKIPDKIQCLNTLTQSLVQHYHQLKPDLNIEGCPVSWTAPILVYFLGVVAADAIMLNKQAFCLWQCLITNNENQLQRADVMETPRPAVIAQCLFYYYKTCGSVCRHLQYYRCLQPLHVNVSSSQTALTFREPGRIIVDIAEGDVDGGGSSQPPQLAPHVLGLD